MSRPHIPAQLTAQITADAGHHCGYCHADELLTGMAFSVEHIVPVARGGATTRANLWRSCRDCNERKGAQTQTADPLSGEIVDLFNPRTQAWNDHFRWSNDGVFIEGQTPVGRATIIALDLNRPLQLVARQRWVQSDWHPPEGDVRGAAD